MSDGRLSEVLTPGIFQRDRDLTKLKLFVRLSDIFHSSCRRAAEVLSFEKL